MWAGLRDMILTNGMCTENTVERWSETSEGNHKGHVASACSLWNHLLGDREASSHTVRMLKQHCGLASWREAEASREQPYEEAILEMAPPAPVSPLDEAAPASSLMARTPRKDHPAKLLQNSWPTETENNECLSWGNFVR